MKLEKCPFCAGKAIEGLSGIWCGKCLTTIRSFDCFDDKKAAYTFWNTRADLMNSPILIEQRDAAIEDCNTLRSNVGYLMVSTIAYAIENNEWVEEFIEWYKPNQWLGSHRAAAIFIAGKINNPKFATNP